MTAILYPQNPLTNMQSEGNDSASPRHGPRRQQNRPPRSNNRAIPQALDVSSDSNIPNGRTPTPRKTPKQQKQGERSSSAATTSSQGPTTAPSHRSQPAPGIPAGNSLATPAKASYAGAAFHASPAPSSLPVPRFFSKSMPAADQQSALQTRLEKEGDRSDSNENSRTLNIPSPAGAAAKSPLDMFFNADRQEKAQKVNRQGNEMFSPASRSVTPSKPKEMFMLELDDTSSPSGSRTQTPPSLQRQRTAPDHIRTLSPEEQRRAEQTQSLKSFLNIAPSTDQSPAQSPFTPQQPASQKQFHSQSSLTTPSQPHNQQFHYGNRNLSPLFHAAAHSPQPGHSPQSGRSPHYNSPYSAGHQPPSPPKQAFNHTQHTPLAAPRQHINGNQHSGGANDDIKNMEDRMRKMLNMG